MPLMYINITDTDVHKGNVGKAGSEIGLAICFKLFGFLSVMWTLGSFSGVKMRFTVW